MVLGRMITLVLATLALVACAGTQQAGHVDPPEWSRTELPESQWCMAQGAAFIDTADMVDAIFIQRGTLFGLNLQSGTVRELLPRQQPLDHTSKFAMFSGDGRSLLIQRDWEGRDSWWAAKADGSDLRRLALPSLEIQQVLRLCQAEFVGALKDGRIVRFNLQGERTYWTPEGEDARRPDTLMVSSPDEQVFAYVAQSGVVVLRPNEDGLTYARRVQGKMIHGWLGNKALVTGDAGALYVTEVSTGQSRKIEYRSLLTKGPRITTVSVHPRAEVLYVVDRSSIPQSSKEIVALNPKTLQRLSTLQHRIPPESSGAPSFSPLGEYEAWPVEPPKEDPYAPNVVLVMGGTGKVVLKTSADMVSVPYVFHPGDEGFVFTDLSRGGKILVYQDGAGRRVDLVQSVEGHPFNGYQWNPRLGAGAKK